MPHTPHTGNDRPNSLHSKEVEAWSHGWLEWWLHGRGDWGTVIHGLFCRHYPLSLSHLGDGGCGKGGDGVMVVVGIRAMLVEK